MASKLMMVVVLLTDPLVATRNGTPEGRKDRKKQICKISQKD